MEVDISEYYKHCDKMAATLATVRKSLEAPCSAIAQARATMAAVELDLRGPWYLSIPASMEGFTRGIS